MEGCEEGGGDWWVLARVGGGMVGWDGEEGKGRVEGGEGRDLLPRTMVRVVLVLRQ